MEDYCIRMRRREPSCYGYKIFFSRKVVWYKITYINHLTATLAHGRIDTGNIYGRKSNTKTREWKNFFAMEIF